MQLTNKQFLFSALMYSIFGTVIAKTRDVEDELNTLTAATLTGFLFKSSGMCMNYVYAMYIYLYHSWLGEQNKQPDCISRTNQSLWYKPVKPQPEPCIHYIG